MGSNEEKKEGPENEKCNTKLFAVENWTLNVALQGTAARFKVERSEDELRRRNFGMEEKEGK